MEYQPGQLVKFDSHLSEGDEAERFVVLEDRGNRMLVESADPRLAVPGCIRPTFVYPKTEMMPAVVES